MPRTRPALFSIPAPMIPAKCAQAPSSAPTSSTSACDKLPTPLWGEPVLPFSSSKGAQQLPPPAVHAQHPSPSFRRLRLAAHFGVQWSRAKAHVRTRLGKPSTLPFPDPTSIPPLASPTSATTPSVHAAPPAGGLVDEVIVDRSWADGWGDCDSESDAASTLDGAPSWKSEADRANDLRTGVWASKRVCRWKVWPRFVDFFSSRFADKKTEQEYQASEWQSSKRRTLWASVFFLVNYILGAIFIPLPVELPDKVFYYGIATLLTIPLPFLCAYDIPIRYPISYQIFLSISTWSWAFYQVLFVFLCGWYDDGHRVFTCGSKDFLATYYYTAALQAVALYGANLKRLPGVLGAVVFLIFSLGLILPDRASYIRNLINFIIYEAVLIYMHYQRERSARKLFITTLQLKVQIGQTQDARLSERKTADSKRRLTSYVFHEVRVPLNTALLAVQNMEASGRVEQVEFNALGGSLSMMSKVLNDVLDFNRMDSGRFESLSVPYSLHAVMRSLFVPLRLATDARGLELAIDLDARIDRAARRAAYEAMGMTPAEVADALEDPIAPADDSVGRVMGDETRLRQIVTNLASNACKFTPTGGKLAISTRLVLPRSEGGKAEKLEAPGLCRMTGQQNGQSLPRDKIVVRIEVSDTGSGIGPQEMMDNKLFSAFNQTEQGRQQGGKGTGLGLALVRQIVKLSGGRLGVRSQVGVGSTFWVELPLGVGEETLLARGAPPPGTAGPATPRMMALPLLDADEEEGAGVGVGSGQGAGAGIGTDEVESMEVAVADKGVIGEGITPPPEEAFVLPAVPWGTPSPDLTRHRNDSLLDASSVRTGRSGSAMHGIMDQGGQFELMLRRYATTSVPTRTMGDFVISTEQPSPTIPQAEMKIPPLILNAPPRRPDRPPNLSPTSLSSDTSNPSLAALRPALTTHSQLSSVPRPPYPSSPSPTVPTFEAAVSASTSRLQSQRFDGATVLVVDDDKTTRTLMKRMLERMGCAVTVAENGAVALKLMGVREVLASPASERSDPTMGLTAADLPPTPGEEVRFDVVFMDNQMPVVSGMGVARRLRAIGRDDFLVGVTGNALQTDQREYLDAGVNRLLTKPVLEKNMREMLILGIERRKADGGG